MPLLDLRGVEKVYDNDGVRTVALRNISFSAERGEFVAIMGPSGSGKSTLLHILGFLDAQSGGEYFFDGVSMSQYTRAEVAQIRNKKMGFVFQSFNLLPRLSVLENITLPLMYSDVPEGEWEDRARQAAVSVGLSHRITHEASRLSGGEKQRAAIARALVGDPSIIFADEPTGNLDSASGQTVMSIIQRLAEEEGKTIVLVTHETYTAGHASRIIRMRDGAIEHDERVTQRHNARAGEFKK